MGIKKMSKRILRDHFWILQDFAHGLSDEVIADSIRKVADENDGLENAVFELGLACLIKTGGKGFLRE